MSATTVRGPCAPLDHGDAADVARIWTFDGYGEGRIAWELTRPEHHVWMGLRDPAGRLVGVHRGLVWHRHLLLKGLCVDAPTAGPTASLTLALAMRDEARARGLTGVAAWVEPHRREAHLAQRLRLTPTTPLVHRFLLPAGRGGAGPVDGGPLSGVVEMPPTAEPLLTPGLPGEPTSLPEAVTRVAWLLDRDRLLVAGVPGPDLGGLREFLTEVAERAGVRPVAFEVALPAADLLVSLGLTRSGAHRASRTPVRLAVTPGRGAS